MIINTPIESPYRVYKTYIVLKNVYDDFFKPQKPHYNIYIKKPKL